MSATWPAPRPLSRPASPGLLLLGGLGLAVCAVAALSYPLIPGRLETSAMALDRGDTGAAETTLHRAITGPPPAPGDVQPLVDMALELSEPEVASDLLSRYLADHGRDVPALRQLADVLEQQHRSVEAAAVLERLYGVTGDIEVLRLVAGFYASLDLAPQRLGALQRLFARKAEDSDQLLELAQRLSAAGDRQQALADLLARLESNPTDPTATTLAGLGAALTIGEPNAAALAARLGHAAVTGERVRSIVQTYVQRGALPLALTAATAAQPDIQREPEMILTLAELEVQNGDDAAALARLQAASRDGHLSPDATPLLIDLELRHGDVATAITQAQGLAPSAMPIGFGSRLVEVARETGRMDALRPLDPARFAAEPAAAAVIALARADRPGADTYARAALADASTLPDDLAAFEDTLRALDLENLAFTRLLVATQQRTIRPSGLRLLTDLITAQPARAAAASPVLDASRDSVAGAGEAWAVVATLLGHEQAVLAWLRGPGAAPGAIATDSLLDLLGLAVQHHQPALAAAAAAALQSRPGLPAGWTREEVAILGGAAQAWTPALARQALAFLADGGTSPMSRTRVSEWLAGASNFADLMHSARGPSAAVAPLLADLRAGVGGPEGIAARLALLMALDPAAAAGPLAQYASADPARLGPLLVASQFLTGRAGPAMDALRHLLAGQPPARQEALLFNVRSLVGVANERPVLELAAGLLGGSWESAYQEALEHAGERGTLVAHLRALAAHASPADRTALANRLVELGDKPAAIQLLQALAVDAGPNAPVVETLMYLWGPTADPPALAWVRARAATAAEGDVPGWLARLDYLGSPATIAAILESRPGLMAHDAKLADVYANALVRTGRHPAAALARAAAATRDGAVLRSLGQAAEDDGQIPLARRLAAQAVTENPNDPASLLQAARLASAAHRSAEAIQLYAKAGPLTPADRVDFADALLVQHRKPEATQQYQAALAQLPEASKPDNIRLRARALHGLGHNQQAAAALTQALQSSPSDAGLRADLLQLQVDAP